MITQLSKTGSCLTTALNGHYLSGKVIALHLDNNTTKAYLCSQLGIVSFCFPDFPAVK